MVLLSSKISHSLIYLNTEADTRFIIQWDQKWIGQVQVTELRFMIASVLYSLILFIKMLLVNMLRIQTSLLKTVMVTMVSGLMASTGMFLLTMLLQVISGN